MLEVSRRPRGKCAGLIRARRRETRARRAARPADVLDALLALRDTTEEALVSMVMEFALAGSHTTSQTLAWCVYEVGRSGAVADGIVGELRREVGDSRC